MGLDSRERLAGTRKPVTLRRLLATKGLDDPTLNLRQNRNAIGNVRLTWFGVCVACKSPTPSFEILRTADGAQNDMSSANRAKVTQV